MGNPFKFIKSWTNLRDLNSDRPHEKNYVTSSEFPGKRALDVSILSGSGLGDAFGRLRVSQLFTIFDSKQLHDKQALFWDDQEVSGSGTTSTYNTNQASTTIAVSNLTAGKRVRQTFQRFNYQPGKSQLIILTTNMFGSSSGIVASVGYFDDNNGVYFSADNGIVYAVIRTNTSGTPSETKIAQTDWNLDTLDGNGPSKFNLDPTKTQILFFDFEWLGVGRVRFGFFIDGVPIYCHEVLNTNTLDKVYMSTPNLPLRYEIENDGTGPAASLIHICSSVASEGGRQDNGILRHRDSGSISSLSAGTSYAALGIRLKSTRLDSVIIIENISLIATTTNDQCHWELYFNPTVAGTFTYNDESESAVQTALGTSSNTVTGGYAIDGGYFSTTVPTVITVPNAIRIGSKIDGTPDQFVLVVRPITNNITVQASMTWRELS